VTVYSLRIQPSYEARSTVLIKPGRENIYVSPVGAPEGALPPTIVQRVTEVINSEIEILRSHELLRRIVEDIGIVRLFPDMETQGISTMKAENNETETLERAVSRASGSLSAKRIKDTDVMDVRFTSHDPGMAADFVNTLIDGYLERHLEVHQSTKAYDFFNAQSNQLEQQLKNATRRLADFRKKYGIISFDQLKQLTLDKYSAVNADRMEIEATVAQTQKRIEKLKAELSNLSEHTYMGQAEESDSAVTNSLRGKLANFELKRADLSSRYKSNDHRIVSLDEAIEKVREMLEREEGRFHGSVRTGINSIYSSVEKEILLLEASLESFQAKADEVQKQAIVYGQELDRLSRLEPELLSLERAVSVHEQNYRLYITKFEESRVSDAMDAAKMVSVSIIEPATPPLQPVPAGRALNVLIALCLGGAAGLGLAFLLEYFDHSLKLPEDVEDKLGVRFLGAIEDLPGKKMDPETSAISALPLQYQVLKSCVMMFGEEKGTKMLGVCCPTRGEGASTVAVNLAVCLAKDTRMRVALVDANLRHPHVHDILKLPVTKGFAEVVHEDADVDEAINESMIPNLYVMSSGVSPPDPTVVFKSPKMLELIEVLRKEFDWVIFDGASLDNYPDSAVLARRLDGVVLVVQAENRSAEVAIRAKEDLEQAGAKILGVVLNRRRLFIPEFIYRRL
jgi:capsular exopolysaccharide synthesis family protein